MESPYYVNLTGFPINPSTPVAPLTQDEYDELRAKYREEGQAGEVDLVYVRDDHPALAKIREISERLHDSGQPMLIRRLLGSCRRLVEDGGFDFEELDRVHKRVTVDREFDVVEARSLAESELPEDTTSMIDDIEDGD